MDYIDNIIITDESLKEIYNVDEQSIKDDIMNQMSTQKIINIDLLTHDKQVNDMFNGLGFHVLRKYSECDIYDKYDIVFLEHYFNICYYVNINDVKNIFDRKTNVAIKWDEQNLLFKNDFLNSINEIIKCCIKNNSIKLIILCDGNNDINEIYNLINKNEFTIKSQ